MSDQPEYPPQPPRPPGANPPPTPPGSGYGPPASSEDRTWGLVAHIGSLLAAFVALAFLAPLVVLLIQGNRSPFVRRHAVESLNFQLTLLIALAVAFVVSLLTLGIALVVVVPLGLVIGVVALIWIIQAGIKANNGQDYRYPLNIRLVK